MSKKRSDGLFQFQLFLGLSPDGKRITKTFYGKSKKEARQKAEDFRRKKDEAPETFKTIAEEYLADCSDNTKIKRIRAFYDYIGNSPITEINAVDIENLLADYAIKNPRTNKPTAHRTLVRYVQSVNQVFVYAQRNRKCSFNPCEYVRIPESTPPQDREALTEVQRKAIDSSSNPAAFPCRLMMYLGLRRGELAALQWKDIDLKNNIVKIYKSYDYKNGRIKAPKTKSGIRYIPIPKSLVNSLISRRKSKDSYVITNADGELMKETNWQYMLSHFCEELGFTFTYHQLRHTYATILYSAGVDVLTAKSLLGHSDVKTTMGIYTHLEDKKKKLSIDKLNEYLA